MIKIKLLTGIYEVENVEVKENSTNLVDAERVQGYIDLEFKCPGCGRWIATAVAKYNEVGGYYEIIRSQCSSCFEGIDELCRGCQIDKWNNEEDE